MLRGRFGDTSGRPYMEGRVSLPRLGRSGNVPFIFDAGADVSVPMPLDAQRMGVTYGMLENGVPSLGVGGTSGNRIEVAYLIFADEQALYGYEIGLHIREPSRELMTVPSLPGRDIIGQWHVTYDRPASELMAEVVSSDARKVPGD